MKNTDTAQQLTLLPATSVPARFQLSEGTRRRGREHIAQLRAQMESRRTDDAEVTNLPARRPVRTPAA